MPLKILPLKISVCAAALVAAATLSSPLMSAASAQQRSAGLECRYIGAVSHRCYYFHSDATWREGMPDYHGSNGG